MTIIIIILVAIIVGALMFFIGKNLAHKQHQQEIDGARVTAETIIEEGRQKAATLKKEALLEAKEENQNYRESIESELKDRRLELKEHENRLTLREENLNRKDTSLETRERSLEEKEQRLDSRQRDVVENEKRVDELIANRQRELEEVANLSRDEARDIIMDTTKDELTHEMAVLVREKEHEAQAEADRKARDILATAMQRCAADTVSESTVTVVSLPNDEMKGRIIGREGRNIRTLETLTGIDLIIDDTPEAVVLSGFDPIRREIARLALERLIQDGRIHPARIEEMVDKARKEMDERMRTYGEEAVFELGIHNMHPDLIKIVGRMHFRTSYGQNALDHSIEVAKLAGVMAAEIGEDETLAKRAGLLHDIGKAIDHEVDGSHVEVGIELARKYHESEEVINSIESHHGDVEPTSVISVIAAAADALSAARPGARSESLENYIHRLERLESIANSFKGVDYSFAIQAGREIRIMVRPEEISDDEAVLLVRDVRRKIEEELEYPGHIKVTVIRETRAIDYAK